MGDFPHPPAAAADPEIENLMWKNFLQKSPTTCKKRNQWTPNAWHISQFAQHGKKLLGHFVLHAEAERLSCAFAFMAFTYIFEQGHLCKKKGMSG